MSLFYHLLNAGKALVITYQVVGETIASQEDDGQVVNAELQVDADGGLRKRTETEVLTLFYTNMTNWSNDPAEDGTGHDFRLVFVSGDAVYSGGNALNTWFGADTAPVWQFANSNSGPNVLSGVYRLDLSDDGGSTTLDSDNFTVTLTVLAP